MIKAGEVAFLKTTGETVYVLEIEVPNNNQESIVHVRRPVAGQDGIRHLNDAFYLGELETLDEQRKRFMAERKDVIEKFTSAAPSDDPQSFLA